MFNAGNTLMIIEIAAREDGCHGMQSQSGRTECWMEGWIAVPEEMSHDLWETKGYCNLIIEDGVLVGFEPLPIPEAMSEAAVMAASDAPSEMEVLLARISALEARIDKLENGGNA